MDQDAIANKLIKLRGDKTRAIVANDIGISVSALAMYERGERMPRDETKLAIAHYYGLSVGEIFFNQPPHVLCGKRTRRRPTC